jgi:hypothetical protein
MIMETTNKSPNKLWRESRSALSFADWIQREKDKGVFLQNKKFEKHANFDGQIDYSNWIEQIKAQNRIDLGIDRVYQKDIKDTTFFGLSKPVLILSSLIIIGAIGYKIYQKRK